MSAVALLLLLAAGPSGWALPGVRLHVQVSEDLEPDRLRSLARPEVVLWVTTRSNGLRRSTAETLQQAGSAFVQVHPPLGAPALAPFVGRVGPWVAERGLDVARVRRWSPGRLAVDVVGPFTDELAARLRILRPVAIRWARGGWPDGQEWHRARSFVGVELSGPGPGPFDCTAVPPRTAVRVRLPIRAVTGDGACGLPLRVEVPVPVDVGDVQRVLVLQPSADLLAAVEDDAGRASEVGRLLDALAGATPHRASVEAPPDGGAR